jgi:hypothetical protein
MFKLQMLEIAAGWGPSERADVERYGVAKLFHEMESLADSPSQEIDQNLDPDLYLSTKQ